MTALEKMRNWLMQFPVWNKPNLPVDFNDGIPEHCGLYCRGIEEISRKIDVLGNVELRSRLHFVFYRTADNSWDNIENANWLLSLQEWVREQNLLGLSPAFGDVPSGEWISAENGRLLDTQQAGTARYAVDITVEFTKLF